MELERCLLWDMAMTVTVLAVISDLGELDRRAGGAVLSHKRGVKGVED